MEKDVKARLERDFAAAFPAPPPPREDLAREDLAAWERKLRAQAELADLVKRELAQREPRR